MKRLSVALFIGVVTAFVPMIATADVRAVVRQGDRWIAWKPADGCKSVERVWIWSDAAPPVAVDGEAWKKPCETQSFDTLLAASARLLEVEVVRTDSRIPISLVAAPVEMWREVPEALLPRFEVARRVASVPNDGDRRWRLRAIGKNEGSWWTEAGVNARRVLVASTKAPARAIRLLASGGSPAAGAAIEVIAEYRGDRAEVVARFETDARGSAVIATLPDSGLLQMSIRHPGHALTLVTATAAEFPLTQRLEPGTRLRGRFLAGESPATDVTVEVEGWLADSVSHLFRETVRSTADGAFSIDLLPRREVSLLARKSGYLPQRVKVDLRSGDQDLGDLTLERGTTLALRVIDERDQPIADAVIDAGNSRVARSDVKGSARLADVSATQPLPVTATARRHLTQKMELRPPFDEVAQVRIPRAVVVKGRVTDADHLPLRAAIRVESGRSYRTAEAADDGTFEESCPPDTELKLVFSSATTTEVAVTVPKGIAGEVRDLGDVVDPKGLVVAGRTIGADGAPIAGARVWALRPSPYGPLAAWMHDNIYETTTAADGTFALSGLNTAPLLLRIDAAGRARLHRQIELDSSLPRLDLYDLTLAEGANLLIKTQQPEQDAEATARVDLRGEGLEFDMLSASVRNGLASVPHVPSGEVAVAVLRGRRIVCEKHVTVPETGELNVDCNGAQVTVRGNVTLGGTPARGGSVSWEPANRPKVAAIILDRISPGGLRQQRALGSGEPSVLITVGDDGRFESNELRPGSWNIRYVAAGDATPPRRIEVPEQKEFETALQFDDAAIKGLVVDSEGTAVPRVVVEIAAQNASALTGPDGSFTLRGLTPGNHEVRARARDGRVASERVTITAHDTPSLRLVLETPQPEEIAVTVQRTAGVPAGGAFVFAEIEGEGLRIMSTDSAGLARLRLDRNSAAQRLRLASFDQGSWYFGDWIARKDAGSSTTIRIPRGGEVRLESKISGPLAITREDGWNVSNLLLRIGAPSQITAGVPLRIAGLAPGRYQFALGQVTRSADVSAGRARDISFD